MRLQHKNQTDTCINGSQKEHTTHNEVYKFIKKRRYVYIYQINMKGQRIYTQKIKHENPSQKKTYSPLYTDISKGSKYRFKRSNQS